VSPAAPQPEPDPPLDETWLNDRSDYQLNFVHGLRNPAGLHVQYRLERGDAPPDADPPGVLVTAEWTADAQHMGFPGIAHGGLVGAILDDAIGRVAALRHRWVVTGRLDVRYRSAAPVGVPLRIEAWTTRWQRRQVSGRAWMLTPQRAVVAEASALYLPVNPELERQMLASWPGFAEFLDREGVG
jgi:acyl-coenzyme A thioesterase PaaI-like protein